MTDEEFYKLRMKEEWWYKIGSRNEIFRAEIYPLTEPPEVKMFWDEFHRRYGEDACYGVMN